jgi:hypothetical protein
VTYPIGEVLEEICLPLFSFDQCCVTYPGGAPICAQFPRIPTDNGEALKNGLAAINTALAPLVPIFNIIDAVIAVFVCVKAIPEAITELDVTTLVECVPDMVEKVSKLLALIPQLALPLLLVEILDCMILALEALKLQLTQIAKEHARILEAGLAAAEPGNVALRTIVDCATLDLNAFLEFANAGIEPLNRLIGLVSAFLGLLGIDALAPVAFVTDPDTIEASLTPLTFLIDSFRTVRDYIPLP